jgi:hypothetical protein
VYRSLTKKMVSHSFGFRRMLSVVTLLGLASTAPLEAQVGLSSGIAQVALVVRVPPRVSMLSVDSGGEIRRRDNVSEGSVNVRFTANTSYRLVVRANHLHSGTRVWIRSAQGDYIEISAGQSVTVAHDRGSGAPLEREVSYRIESVEQGQRGLPLRYEVLVDPLL